MNTKADLLPHSSAQPKICSACEVALQMSAKDGRRANHVHFCAYSHWDPHVEHGDRVGVLALAAAQGGVILRWELTGPLTREEAKNLAMVYVGAAEQLGVPLRGQSVN